jgi:pSer/pThr/pTyr-binding forkhead associated (FHA) protein
MWAIKVLNGPQAGRIFQLKEGIHSLGRSDQVTIQIKSSSVSKVHAQIMITSDKVILSDNRSSNGVVVNGVKIQNKSLKAGDKFSLGEVIFDVIQLPNYVSILPDMDQPLPPATSGTNALATQNYAMAESSADDLQIVSSSLKNSEEQATQPELGLQERIENYIEDVALPGVYEYSSKFDLKYVVLSFVILFVVMVTALSVFPVLKISRDFVVDESTRRADSLAKLLVQENRNFIISDNDISVNVRAVSHEAGVDQAFIIDALSGQIIAPQRQRGKYSNIAFVQRARKKPNRYTEVLDNQIGVSRPILTTNELTGEPSAAAYAIVLYNLDKVALDVPRTLSLMIQILLITILAGSVLYFFLYKVITKPLFDLNKEINDALKEGSNNIELRTPTPIFQNLVSNINSALSRMSQEDSGPISVGMGDKSMEASELVQMFPVAAIIISPENEMVMAHNDLIVGHPLFDDDQILDKYLDDLPDPSLVENLKDLLQKAVDNPNQKHTNGLPSSSGIQFEVSIKSIQEMGNISYYVVCFTEVYDEENYEE